MKPRVWVQTVTFSDNSRIGFDPDDIVILVGPNNAGKSATLKEIFRLARQKSDKGKVLLDIEFSTEGTEELKSYLETFSVKAFNGNPEPTYSGMGFSVYGGGIEHQFRNYQNGLGDLQSIFLTLLSTESRLSAANPPNNINLTNQAPTHPIHFLQKDDSVEKQFSGYFRQAFGLDLIVHRNAGGSVPLYVGKKPVPKKGEDRVSIGYITELQKLDLLHEQGDGMRSFVGVLLHSLVAKNSILLVDEPEAFLHPPQARLLGKMLANDLPKGKQLFFSTHSEDFLKGLLDSGSRNVKIVRLIRDKNTNRVSILNQDEIKEIWSDSLLRHSNILSGLFHSRVIVCESDSDCRFYSAILSSLHDEPGAIVPDVLFVHCGGKHRAPTVLKALKRIDVDVRVVVDFDVLNDTNPLRDIVVSLGGKWERVEKDWKVVKMEIEKKRPELLTVDLKKEIESILAATNDRIFPKDQTKKIESALKRANAWSEAKNAGKAYLPSGTATICFERLQIELQKLGIFVLEVGELERFSKSIGNHGPKWVSEVLLKNLKTDPELEAARQFVKRIAET